MTKAFIRRYLWRQSQQTDYPRWQTWAVIGVLIFVALVCVSSLAQAQNDAIEVDGDCLEAAQEWYDTADFADIINADVLKILAPDNQRADWESIALGFRITGDVALELAHPACISVAVEAFKDGMYTFANYANARSEGDDPGLVVAFTVAGQRIGEMRGYLLALGVEIDQRDDVLLYWK